MTQDHNAMYGRKGGKKEGKNKQNGRGKAKGKSKGKEAEKGQPSANEAVASAQLPQQQAASEPTWSNETWHAWDD